MPINTNSECHVHSALEIAVPRQTSWHVPRGSYTASIRSINLTNRFAGSSTTRIARILFNVHVPGSPLDYLAKLDLRLDLSEGSDLWNLLCRLISRQALQQLSGQTFDLETLIGVECDVEIDHNTDKAEEYDFPLVVVADVQELGRLVRTGLKEQV